MKILHIINSLAKGGAERLLVDIVPLYSNYDQDVSILQISNQHSSNDYLEILSREKIQVLNLTSGSLYNLSLILQLKSFIKKGNYDVVHVHLFPSMYWASLAFKLMGRTKPVLIFTEHSTQNNRLNNPIFRPIDKFVYKSYDIVIAISEAIQTKLINWTNDKNKIKLIRNGVNTSHFKNAALYNSNFFEESFKIPLGAKILLMTARFLYPKDHVTVVKALKHLPQNFHVIFAGEGDGKEAVRKAADEIGLTDQVHFAGFRTDVPSLMKSVDYNILSSKYEGMSGVTLEALAAGKPFLGSDVAGINDVVPDKRFLFEAGNEISLSDAIKKIDQDETLKGKMIKDGIAFANTFDVSIMIEKHIALYKSLIGNN